MYYEVPEVSQWQKDNALKDWVLFETDEKTWKHYEIHLSKKINEKLNKEENKPIKKMTQGMYSKTGRCLLKLLLK